MDQEMERRKGSKVGNALCLQQMSVRTCKMKRKDYNFYFQLNLQCLLSLCYLLICCHLTIASAVKLFTIDATLAN